MASSPFPNDQGLAALAALAAKPFTSVDEAIEGTLRLIADLFGVGLAMVHRLEGDDIVVSHVCDRMGLGIQPPITVHRRDTFCDETLRILAPLIVPDADADPRFCDMLGKRMVGTRTYIGVPLILGEDRVYGTLCAHDRRVLDLGRAEIDALLVLSRLLSTQIDRDEARAIQAESARRLDQRSAELGEAIRQLDALRDITELISAELDLEALLRRVIASAISLLGAFGGAISLVGETISAPRRLTATYNLPSPPPVRDAPGDTGLMGQVLTARGPVVIGRYDDLVRPLTDPAFHAASPWVAVPIWWQGEIIGTFGIAGKDPTRTFGEREIELLNLLAKHAAVAIENARLYAASRDLGAAGERNRLASEIHDTLAQSLLALTFQLRTARGHVPSEPDRAIAELAEAEERARAALEEARRSVWNLGPAALETGTLVEAFQGEVAAAERDGIPGRLVVTGSPRPLPAEAQLALLRVTQEAMTNVRKHAAATRVELELTYGPTEATLVVTDNGHGFDPDLIRDRGPTRTGGFGLPGMGERIRRAGGSFTVESAPGSGTRVVAAVTYGPSTGPPAVASSPPLARPARVLRVVIADDHPAVRAGLAALLRAEPDITVVGEAGDGEQALSLVSQLRPDVLLVDLRMPNLPGVETIRRLTRLGVSTRAIAVTTFAQDEFVLQALRAGARGYLLKDASAEELAAAVRTVAAGGILLDPEVAGKLAEGLISTDRLTAREREVLALIGEGLSDKEIAGRIGTTAKTANFHVANVLAKLGAQNRTEAVRLAYERGLLVDV